MWTFDNTFAEEIAALINQWDNFCPAAALFYWGKNSNDTGLRIEATEIMREFVDNIQFGRDPEGWLFYGTPQDLDTDSGDTVYYRVYTNDESPMAIRIDFFGRDPNTPGIKPFAQFLTKDTAKIPIENIPADTGSGLWRKLSTGISSATVSKLTNDPTIKLSAHAIGKNLTFNLPDSSSFTHALHIDGAFHFQNIKDLNYNTLAITNYNTDRILYYDQKDSTKLIGVFYPSSDLFPDGFNNEGDVNPAIATCSDDN
ncbi:uncharacterized protein C8R40DRAFT_1171753 [Lentinula edodes]|uniref:uncharacterized protein n=1 Tax=Lentinula edodes TaxID=5353 RepID=UPI001E8DAADA|nr:uncharacterized protein C8R40DRAFT_1171753 [Lentinula edodes]KAH7874217.1 hypothetical protein C8R40DRAFT_1171753 [Lentinula edodes]